MFQAKAPEAFEVLTRHLQSSDPRIAITAASAILDRAYGKPAQPIDANVTSRFDHLSDEQIAARLAPTGSDDPAEQWDHRRRQTRQSAIGSPGTGQSAE